MIERRVYMEKQTQEKKVVAQEALQFIENDTVIGIGSGSTLSYFIQYLGEKIKKDGLTVTAVPTSVASADLCKKYGIPLYIGEFVPDAIDITIDGADEFDDQLNLIKGGGGDLLWEKIVASAGKRRIIITDSTKHVTNLGAFGLPVEVVPYAVEIVQKKLKEIGFTSIIRTSAEGSYFLTDEHNFILDCEKRKISDVKRLGDILDHITGIVEHGLFIQMTDIVLMATKKDVDIFVKPNIG